MKRKGLLVAAVLLVVAAVVPTAVSLAGTDPEPTVVEYPASNFDPGPGWPAGWTPPAPPTGLTESERAGWEELKPLMWDPKPERLEFRVMAKLPDWTKEYPYVWQQEFVTCGVTTYSYNYPYPDTTLFFRTYKYTISAVKDVSGSCTFSPVKSIAHNLEVTPDEAKQLELGRKMAADAAWSRGGNAWEGGLEGCPITVEGSINNIQVCLNDGNASAKFDVPAFNDPAVGRVRVPVRFVSELMGAQVAWDQARRTVTINFPQVSRNVVHPVSLPGFTLKDWYRPESLVPDRAETYKLEDRTVEQPARSIQLTVDHQVAVVDGREIPLDAPPIILPPGRVMIPVRFVAEQMGARVYWVGGNPIFRQGEAYVGRYQVHIYTRFHPLFEYPSWPLENRATKV